MNNKQKSVLVIVAVFFIMSVLYEIGFYLIKGQTDLEHTPITVAGALIAGVIVIITSKNK
jgi:type IV secretory pathway VirB6-like protein